ncbi:MAG: hypothetical protein A2041_15365 [Bacteroidetes bacterium GWA2_31_9b]|nr:MAG: hypothetical protein A2041_15365 [Bacteroidetes bacterium GWA2_31_9b]
MKMKKFFTTLFLLLIVVFVFADHVNKHDAQMLAEKFFANCSSKILSEIQVKDIFEQKYNEETSFYIFTFEKGGFVIVSADDLAYPVLGYSTTSFATENIENPSTLMYLEKFKKQIDQAKKQKSTSIEIQKLWIDYKNGIFPKSTKAVAPLLTTIWNQSPYYNQLCPAGTPSGCVATAMSQIMNYHGWPESGNGWHRYIPSDHPTYGEQFAGFDSTTYDWANMPDDVVPASSDVEKLAVATLMYHAGISVEMNYDPLGSGAQSPDVLFALTSYFKYDPTTIQMYDFDVTNTTEWLTLAKSELDNSRPIYYDGGSESDGGHAWVCDGYDASNNLHINWGWGGYYNGYFAANAMEPNSYSFSEYNSMIIGIQPGTLNQNMLWTKQASAFTTASRGIQFISAVDDRTAWAVAYDGSGNGAKIKEYTKTTDGGNNWKSGTISLSNTSDYAAAMISAIDGNTAWVALFGPSGGGKIVKTTDGGTTWTAQTTAAFTEPNGFPNVVHFWDENNGFCMGDPNGGYFEIYTTLNGGETWSRVPQANIPSNTEGEYGTVGCYTVFGSTVWFATNKGRIYKSTNKGLTWVAYQTPITGTYFELSFKDASTGIIQRRGDGDNKVQYITSNGGETWTALTPTGNFYTSSFAFIPGSDILISTGVDYDTPFMGVSYSTDNGTTFTDYADFYKKFQFTAIGVSSEDAIWAGSFNNDKYNDGMWHYGNLLFAANFTVNKTSVSMNDSSIIYTDNSYGTPDSWEWNFGDGASPATASGKGPHTVKYTTQGKKSITLTVSKAIKDHEVVIKNMVNVSAPVGIEDIKASTIISIYPNPAKDIFYVSNIKNAFVSIYNTAGILVYEKENVTNETPIQITNLNSGIYYIKVVDSELSITQILSVTK